MTGLLALFVGLLAAGMPIFLVLGLCAGAMFAASGQPLVGAAQLVINELNSPTLMALPLFVMAAAFMRFGGVADVLVRLAAAWLGGLPGSLGLVTVVACTLFAAICGSSVATALAMGTILVPAMIARGYPVSFALGVVGASGTIGIVHPAELFPGPVRHRVGAVGATAVPGRHPAGPVPGRRVLPLGPVCGPSPKISDRAGVAAQGKDDGHACGAACVARAVGRHGRHLRRLRHRDRGRGACRGRRARHIAHGLSRVSLDARPCPSSHMEYATPQASC